MENFLNRLLTIKAENWESNVLDTKVYNDDDETYRIYEVTTSIKFNDVDEPVIENHQIMVPLSVSGVVNNAKFNRVSITSAQQSDAIKAYNGKIKIPGMYIDTYGTNSTNPYVSFKFDTHFMDYNSFLLYFGLLDEFGEGVDPGTVIPLDEESKKVIREFRVNERTVTKMRLLYEIKEPLENELTPKFVTLLLRLMKNPDATNVLTPVDFIYLDTMGGLIKELNSGDNFLGFRSQLMYNVNKNSSISINPIQNAVDRYFNMQASAVRNIQSSQDTNALSIAVQSKKIFFYGTTSAGTFDKLRLYNNYFIGVLDPEKTHDGPNINTDNDLTLNTSIENGEIYVTLYNKKFEEVRIPYSEYSVSKVLAENQVDFKNKKIIPNDGVYVYFQFGKYYQTKNPNELDYYRPINNCLSPATALVPFINKSDATRAMLGAHMIGQAIPVVGAQPGIVTTPENKQLYRSSGVNIYSSVNGRVVDILDEKYVKIETETGEEEIIESPGFIKSKASTTNKFDVNVKVGDKITKGDPIFTINSFKDKEFSLGVPLYTAYTTYFGHDHEDGIILTETGAAKLAHPMIETLQFEFPSNVVYAMTNEGLIEKGGVDVSRYSEYGIINPGVGVRGGEPLIDFYFYTDPNSKYGNLKKFLGVIDEALEHATLKVPAKINNGVVKDVRVIFGYTNDLDTDFVNYYKNMAQASADRKSKFFGRNVGVSSVNSGYSFIVEVDVEYFNTIRSETLSNKITNKYGSKGVVTYIIPDEEAPTDENGNKIECIISPLTTFSRKNPAQIYESKLGLVGKIGYEYVNKCISNKDFKSASEFLAEAYDNTSVEYWTESKIKELIKSVSKYGYLRFVVSPFDSYYTVDRINKLIETAGYGDGKQKVFFPNIGKWTNNPVTLGYVEIIRLAFIPENKAKATSMINVGSELPFGLGGIKPEGQKWGNQEVWAMLAHGKQKELSQIISENEDKQPGMLSALITLGMSLE